VNRRLHSLVLIALMSVGAPMRAADVAIGRRATVEIPSASPAPLSRLAQAVRSTGASVRVVRCGAWSRVEIVSASRARLSAALAAIQKQAAASGLPVRSRRADGGAVQAVSAKPDGATRAPADGQPSSAVLCPPPQPHQPSGAFAARKGRTPPPDAVVAAPSAPRGPPAQI